MPRAILSRFSQEWNFASLYLFASLCFDRAFFPKLRGQLGNFGISVAACGPERSAYIENGPRFFCHLTTWLVQLPVRSQAQFMVPFFTGNQIRNSFKQYSLKKVWKYPLNHGAAPASRYAWCLPWHPTHVLLRSARSSSPPFKVRLLYAVEGVLWVRGPPEYKLTNWLGWLE